MGLSGSNQAASISMAYDSMGRLTQFLQNAYAVTYSYNVPNGQTVVSRPSGRVITLNVDQRGRLLLSQDGSLGDLITYEYDNGNRVLRKVYGNGVETSYSYNPNSLIVDLVHSHNSATLSGYHYVLNKEGHRLLAQDLRDSAQSEEYGYDSNYRLISFKRGTPSGNQIPSPSTQSSWQLDPVSNWMQNTTDGVVSSFVSNNVNEYTQVDGSQYVYDNRGNLLDDGIYLYSYDYENRLVEVKDKSTVQTVAQYSYGPFGRRINKALNGTTIEYLYCFGNVIEQYDSGVLEKEYMHGSGTADKVIFSNGNANFCLSNSLGSVIGITDATGNLVETYQYAAYGKPTILDSGGAQISTSSIGNPYLFGAMRYDYESGLYHTLYRKYSNQIGRFLSRDPVRSINPYVYVESDPVNLVDPLGLWVKVPGKKNIWMAEKDGEKLEDLAAHEEIKGSKKDWVCLWPEEMRNSAGYPKVMKCDEFDVSNLTQKAGIIQWGTRIGVIGGGFWDEFVSRSWGFRQYESSKKAYDAVKNSSSEGKTPISLLLVDGHSCSSCEEIGHSVDNTANFSGRGLKTYAKNFLPSPSRVTKKKGPLRCWFTRTAQAYGLACHSGGAWAPGFAQHVLRGNSWAHGTPTTFGKTLLILQIGSGAKHFTMTGLLNDPQWVHCKAKN